MSEDGIEVRLGGWMNLRAPSMVLLDFDRLARVPSVPPKRHVQLEYGFGCICRRCWPGIRRLYLRQQRRKRKAKRGWA